ncbi:DUF4189 domain-containing protein [Mesorhizobium sp. BH1-1-4]|uniref:DUF4189 domain-containing protein n=1 Tax=Mesorhizobium sp. BH1-1-4 TaxID=2876662 RepID=UPI001CD06FF4|nr:DUF4189 domain-containing protein [Mesorhizobium sp. BH1-1-4]MBZ9993122.1 DUF4189 domain-containing protein [Mesorhizobium sp. BH1-1-4]
MRARTAAAALGILLLLGRQVSSADLSAGPSESPAPPPKDEKGIWAAIAYSSADAKHGFFWGADERQEAMDIAVKHCQNAGGHACTVVTVSRNHRHRDDDDQTGFPYNHCGALAVAKRAHDRLTRWGAKSAETRSEAEDLALQACEAAGEKCTIREWVCT